MKLLVVGGGLIGLGVAWRASQRGLDVTVVDAPTPHAASRVGAGLLIPAGGKISRHHLALRQASADMYPSFVEELEAASGVSCGFNPCGNLTVAYDPGGVDSVEGLANCLLGLGVKVTKLDQQQCLQLEPGLTHDVVAGFYTDDHQVDPGKLLDALAEGCRGSSVHRVEGRAVSVEPERVTLADGTTLKTDRVVVAAGAWVAELLELPVFPVKGEVVQLEGTPDLLRHNLVLRREDLYVANRGDGRYVVGATEEEVGFDTSFGGTQALKQKADRLVPAFRGLTVTDARLGFRPKVGDGLPVLGDLEGVTVASAHYRNGILLTPVTAKLIVEYLVSGEVPELIKPFLPGRDCRHREQKSSG